MVDGIEKADKTLELPPGEPIHARQARRLIENGRNVHDRVAGGGERQLCLPSAVAVHSGEDQNAGIENSGERGEPGLVVVLRAIVGEDRIGKMTFH